jgi:steroid delta-isomerase-like uncharacterized protein
MSEANKAVVRRFTEAILNRGDPAAAGELFAPDFAFYFAGAEAPLGLAGFLETLRPFHEAFPDVRFAIENLIAEGDKVAARFRMTGTHRGAFQGIAPTGRAARWGGVAFFRLAGGKIVEEWPSPDVWGLLRQLGAVIAPPP